MLFKLSRLSETHIYDHARLILHDLKSVKRKYMSDDSKLRLLLAKLIMPLMVLWSAEWNAKTLPLFMSFLLYQLAYHRWLMISIACASWENWCWWTKLAADDCCVIAITPTGIDSTCICWSGVPMALMKAVISVSKDQVRWWMYCCVLVRFAVRQNSGATGFVARRLANDNPSYASVPECTVFTRVSWGDWECWRLW